jgi:hypothetical protein
MGVRCRRRMNRGRPFLGGPSGIHENRFPGVPSAHSCFPTHFKMDGIKLFSGPASGKFGGGVPTSVPEDCLGSPISFARRGMYPR